MPVIVGLLIVTSFAACSQQTPKGRSAPPAAQEVAYPPVLPETPEAHSAIRGTVQETMDSGGYTYLRLKTTSGEVWAAVNQSKVKTGSDVTVVNAVLMGGFESKTLKRTFDRIFFGELGAPGAAVPAAVGQASPTRESMADTAAQHMAVAAGPPSIGEIKVPKAEGPEGNTVAQVIAQRRALKDKPVAVRGKVVKFLPEIMGKNWIHLRDGTGSRDTKDDDITVTTTDTAAVGDVVLVTGTVRIDRDFGAGYAYGVIIEEAHLSK